MRRLFFLLALAVAAPLHAQGPLLVDIHGDIAETQQKFMALANAIPESAYNWRPGPGVRSVSEVFMHIASENYGIPVMLGAPAPAATGITSDYNTTEVYAKKQRTRAEVIAELQASFQHLHQALHVVNDQNLSEKIKFFGQDYTRQKATLLIVTHLHEHLGQLIAYARSNNVVPPWSK